MKTFIRIVFIAIALLGMVCLSGCKKPEEPQNQTAETKIAPEGGVYKLDNGVTLIVPSGAVSEETEVKVEYKDNLDGTTGSLPTDIQGLVKFLPEGLVFSKPIQVSMPLNQPISEAITDIVYWSDVDKRWYITDLGVKDGDKVTFYVEHFSTYGAIGGAWSSVFSQMDAKVGNASTENAISVAVKDFLESNMWEDMGLKDLRFSTAVNGGNICAKTCGLYGYWANEKDGATHQGGATYKDKSTNNIIINLALYESQMTSHMREQMQLSASQGITDRLIEIYGKPCPSELSGSATPTTIEKGKTTQVTITAHCDGSPLAGQLLQLSYSPELSCDVVNKKTDDNGQITITVKGESEGNGIIYVKAISAIDADLVTETQIPVNVGGGEIWEVEWRVSIQKSATASGFAPKYPGISDISIENATHSLSYDIVGSATITTKKKSATGTFNLTVENVQYSLPEWKASWTYLFEDGNPKGSLIYNVPFDVKYILNPKHNVSFTDPNHNYLVIHLGEDKSSWEENAILVDKTTITSTCIKTMGGQVFDLSLTTPIPYDYPIGIIPGSLYTTLEEGTHTLVCNDDMSPTLDANGKCHHYSLSANMFDFPYDNFDLLFREEITGTVSKSESAHGTITIRRIDSVCLPMW